MKFAILLLEYPKMTGGSEWDCFQKTKSLLTNLRRTTTFEMLAEGTWQIDLTKGLSEFSAALQAVETGKAPYRVLFFDDRPNWISTKT